MDIQVQSVQIIGKHLDISFANGSGEVILDGQKIERIKKVTMILEAGKPPVVTVDLVP